MISRWAEILPLFIVRWIALRYCEQIPHTNGRAAVTVRPDVLILTRFDSGE
jgi:hypothetical protein